MHCCLTATTRTLLRNLVRLRSRARKPDIVGQNFAPVSGTNCAVGFFCCDTSIIAIHARCCCCVLLLPLLLQLFALLLLLL